MAANTEVDQEQEKPPKQPETTNHRGVKLNKLTVMDNLECLELSNDGTMETYRKLDLVRKHLTDISILESYPGLETVNLSNNLISDTEVLGKLTNLQTINLSHNRVIKFLDFSPPVNLKVALYSHNFIEEIPNLASFRLLEVIDLSHNNIIHITGISELILLRSLNLSHNRINRIPCIERCPLKFLDLSFNEIIQVDNLDELPNLQYLDLSNNRLISLIGIPQKLPILTELRLENNQLDMFSDLDRLNNFRLLRKLRIHGNSIALFEDYRIIVVHKLPKITDLDYKPVSIEEKVMAKNTFAPDIQYLAIRDHMSNVVLRFIQDHSVLETTLPDPNDHYKIVALIGPPFTFKHEICLNILREFPDYFQLAKFHSTHTEETTEFASDKYILTDESTFEADMRKGKFICCYKYKQYWYGLQYETLETIALTKSPILTFCALEGLLSWRQTHFKPTAILILPTNILKYQNNLTRTNFNVEEVVKCVKWYRDFHDDNSGYFDNIISCDNFDDTVINAVNIVKAFIETGTVISTTANRTEFSEISTYVESRIPTEKKTSTERQTFEIDKNTVVESEFSLTDIRERSPIPSCNTPSFGKANAVSSISTRADSNSDSENMITARNIAALDYSLQGREQVLRSLLSSSRYDASGQLTKSMPSESLEKRGKSWQISK
ncbi:hypothetical protein SNEBB_010471 [Seison nebaliae]|nr:hypothetical protein SNEBB_010471 [Seison nebaliae]